MTAREAGTPTRLVRSNPLFGVQLILATCPLPEVSTAMASPMEETTWSVALELSRTTLLATCFLVAAQ